MPSAIAGSIPSHNVRYGILTVKYEGAGAVDSWLPYHLAMAPPGGRFWEEIQA